MAKRPEIIARIAELTVRVSQQSVDKVQVSRDYVFGLIGEGISMAREQRRASDMFKGAELIGRNLKMWDPAGNEVDWDGDLSKLNDDQLHNLAKSLRKLADPAIVARVERQLAIEAGEIIDVTPEPQEEERIDDW